MVRTAWMLAGSLGSIGACNAIAGIEQASVRPPEEAGAGADAADASDDAAADGADSAAGGWCAQQPGHNFCDDFDEAPLADGFGPIEGDQAGSTLARDQGSSPPSPPFALLATARALASGDSARADCVRQFPSQAAPTLWSLAFDVFVESYPGNAGLYVAMLHLGDGVRFYELYVDLYNDGSSLQEVFSDSDGGSITPPGITLGYVVPPRTWTTVNLQVTLDANRAATVSFGPGPKHTYPLAVQPFPGTTSLRAGITSLDGPSMETKVRIDNLWFDIRP